MSAAASSAPSAQTARATAFRRLHDDGIFVMPCAWDAGSARLLEAAGFAAIGTTSGGVNWSRGRQDYVYTAPRASMLADYGEVASAVDLPVSGDLENGYGATAVDVAETIREAIGLGMVGGSIEDQSSEPGAGLFPLEVAAERISAAREAADRLLPDFTITARAESFFGGVADPFADAVERANRYLEAGADCIFVPGVADLESLRALVEAVAGPISLGIGSGGGTLDLASLREVGIRRVSTGGALPRALYALLAAAGQEMLTSGTFAFTTTMFDENELNALMLR